MKLVIHPKHFPTRPPIFAGIVWWLFLDRLNAPGWAYGVIGTLFFFVLVCWVIAIFTEKHADVTLTEAKKP